MYQTPHQERAHRHKQVFAVVSDGNSYSTTDSHEYACECKLRMSSLCCQEDAVVQPLPPPAPHLYYVII